MKKLILIATLALTALAPPAAAAAEKPLTLVIAGGPGDDSVRISLTRDGRSYVIDAGAPLAVGGETCANAAGNPNEVICAANAIAGFDVSGNGGNDVVRVARQVSVPVTLRGGPGEDRLVAGGGPDKLVGGPGDDILLGGPGDDWLGGGPGDDRLFGGPGDDRLLGGAGLNALFGGPGRNRLE